MKITSAEQLYERYGMPHSYSVGLYSFFHGVPDGSVYLYDNQHLVYVVRGEPIFIIRGKQLVATNRVLVAALQDLAEGSDWTVRDTPTTIRFTRRYQNVYAYAPMLPPVADKLFQGTTLLTAQKVPTIVGGGTSYYERFAVMDLPF